ncbi:MAG: type VII toxin-antitoxin system HepT family RNase toxin [Actinomycetes bacterium]
MVDAVRLARLLQRAGEQLSRLRAHAGNDRAALRADDLRLAAVKYGFITTLEAVLDVTHHVLASELWGPAETAADAVRLLVGHGVLEVETGERIARAVGFRNVLVHGYADVDDDLVVANLDRLDDVQRFVDQVREWASGGTTSMA